MNVELIELAQEIRNDPLLFQLYKEARELPEEALSRLVKEIQGLELGKTKNLSHFFFLVAERVLKKSKIISKRASIIPIRSTPILNI